MPSDIIPQTLIQQAVDQRTTGAPASVLDRLWQLLGLSGPRFGRTPASQTTAFTMAFVGLAAKMAKADGVAVTTEADAFERCFHVRPSQLASIRRVYDLAKADVAGYDYYAQKISRLLVDEPAMLRAVLECLFVIATADGVLHEREDHYLHDVAATFGIGESEFRALHHLFVMVPGNPYLVLDMPPTATDAELRQRYLHLVRENHPDALASRGVPQEFQALADRKLAAINAAYEEIRRARATAAPA